MLNLIVWIGAGATAGALIAAIRLPEAGRVETGNKVLTRLLVYAGGGAIVGLAIYATLFYTMYHELVFSI